MGVVPCRCGKSTVAGFIALLVMGAACSATAEPSVKEKGPPSPQAIAPVEPPEVALFLSRAKVSDRIVDPVARCLAFPDIPGNHWPAGLVQAHCHFLFDPRITPEQIGQFLDRGETDQLDALFARDLARHFSKTDFSEVIHLDFEAIDASEKSNSLTRRWLEMAPASPFAQTARARYFRKKAVKVRGEDYASNTSAQSMQDMSRYAEKAIELYEKALKTEPRMMAAFGGLITMGMFASRPDVIQSAYKRSMAIDPGCQPVNDAMMIALRQEWGGTDAAMQAFSAGLAPQLDKRPLLALTTTLPYTFNSDTRYDAGKIEESRQLAFDASVRSSDPDAMEDYARAMSDLAPDSSRWQILMYLLESTRFQTPRTWASYELDQAMISTVKDEAWAVTLLAGMVGREPGNGYIQCLLATHHEKLKRSAEAEEHFLLGVADADGGPPSLLGLMRLAQQQGHIEGARRYYQMLKIAYPEYLERFSILAP